MFSEKYKDKHSDMEEVLDESTIEMREKGCRVSEFLLRVKAFKIMRELGKFIWWCNLFDGWSATRYYLNVAVMPKLKVTAWEARVLEMGKQLIKQA